MWQRIKNLYHLGVALSANIFYGFPSRKLIVIGVTGTDGKTTTSNLIYHILKESGKTVSLVSTVGAKINGKDYDLPFHVTTPSPFALEKLISEASKGSEGKRYLVLEVTSHALDQNRVAGIHFFVSVITNVTNEHLDYHKTWENYLKTKAKLLKNSDTAILNRDDKSYEPLREYLRNSNVKILEYNQESKDYKNIPGEFNKYNIAAASAVAGALGVTGEQIEKALLTFELPEGRMEEVYDKDFRLIIDFAHTPNSIENVLSSLRPEIKGRIIHVFGSAGERDSKKRPEMGKASSKFSDIIILTSEDPRSENPKTIIEEIRKGIDNKKEVLEIEDRRDAIRKAVSIARKGDLVIVTGKGHEKSMNMGNGEIEWSDKKEVLEALKK